MEFSAPVLNYTLLSPMLILLGGALIGVLVEAFMSKALRPITQLSVTLGSLVLALVQVWKIRNEQSTGAAMGSVVIVVRLFYCKAQSLLFLSSLFCSSQIPSTSQLWLHHFQVQRKNVMHYRRVIK
jgi:hypothetical protein